jgi:hypothetical protein
LRDHLNHTSLARHLDRFFDAGPERIFNQASLRAIDVEGLSVERVHNDTTSRLVFGNYAHPEDPNAISITRGHSNDQRPDLKQVMYGLTTTADGVLVAAQVLSGNTSDTTWNADVLKELKTRPKVRRETPLHYAGDSALVTQRNLDLAADNGIVLTSRMPRTLSVTDTAVIVALYEPIPMEPLGTFSDVKGATSYEGCVRPRCEVLGHQVQRGVYRATPANERTRKAVLARQAKELAAATKAAKKLSSSTFACEPDAQADADAFLSAHRTGPELDRLISVNARIVSIEVEAAVFFPAAPPLAAILRQASKRPPRSARASPRGGVSETPSARSELDERLVTGARFAGRYVVERHLGQGGMGSVYAVRDELLHEAVALKLASSTLGERVAMESLRREVSLARRVTHPNVARVYDLGTDQGRLSMTLELVDGVSLARRLRAGALPPSEVVWMGHQLASALASAHAAGVLHLDLKPGNVMVAHGQELRIAVVDSGIAQAIGARADGTGTLEYMAPEQLLAEALGGAADVYATATSPTRSSPTRAETSPTRCARFVARSRSTRSTPSATPSSVASSSRPASPRASVSSWRESSTQATSRACSWRRASASSAASTMRAMPSCRRRRRTRGRCRGRRSPSGSASVCGAATSRPRAACSPSSRTTDLPSSRCCGTCWRGCSATDWVRPRPTTCARWRRCL